MNSNAGYSNPYEVDDPWGLDPPRPDVPLCDQCGEDQALVRYRGQNLCGACYVRVVKASEVSDMEQVRR